MIMMIIDSAPTGYVIPAVITALIAIVVIGTIALLWGLSPLINPGLLSAASSGTPLGGYLSHAEFENDCLFCHAPWGGSSNGRCLSCHVNISLELRQQNGLHSNLPADMQCSSCHSEHRGRQADNNISILLTEYPHNKTDFDLVGGHSGLPCVDCHQNGQYRIETTCRSCHPEPDAHLGKYGTDCEQCHAIPHKNGFRAEKWTPVTLNHDFFPLSGGHTVNCEQCHTSPDFRAMEAKCIACHVEQDVHTGWYGVDCSKCHTINGWLPSIFDHNRLALSLTGGHAKLACESCHLRNQYIAVEAECTACHTEPDFHISGQFGKNCQSCHLTDSWLPGFLRIHPFPTTHGFPEQSTADCLVCHPVGYINYNCDSCHQGEIMDPALLRN